MLSSGPLIASICLLPFLAAQNLLPGTPDQGFDIDGRSDMLPLLAMMMSSGALNNNNNNGVSYAVMPSTYNNPNYGHASYARPAYGRHHYGGYGAPTYAAPGYGGSSYGAPAYGAPSYIAPAYGAPSYVAPAYGASGYTAPGYGVSSYAAPAPQYGAQMVPVVSTSNNANPMMTALITALLSRAKDEGSPDHFDLRDRFEETVPYVRQSVRGYEATIPFSVGIRSPFPYRRIAVPSIQSDSRHFLPPSVQNVVPAPRFEIDETRPLGAEPDPWKIPGILSPVEGLEMVEKIIQEERKKYE